MGKLVALFIAFVAFVRWMKRRGRAQPTCVVDELALRRAVNKSMTNRKHYETEDA